MCERNSRLYQQIKFQNDSSIYIYAIVILRLLYTRGINGLRKYSNADTLLIYVFIRLARNVNAKREHDVQSMSSYRSVNSNVKACGYIVIEYKIH